MLTYKVTVTMYVCCDRESLGQALSPTPQRLAPVRGRGSSLAIGK